MGIKYKEIEIKVSRSTYKYYEDLGYEIPKKLDSKKHLVADESKYITVKVEDLTKGSNIFIDVICDNKDCNKEYSMKYQDYTKCNHDGKIYCSKCACKLFNSGENCYLYGGKYAKRGKEHPNWNPNLTDEEREQQRHTLENSQFIKRVMTRDNYTCQCCKNKINHNGVVHHLNGWDYFKDQRYLDENGITLCSTCHKNFHMKYGYGNNTKEQFEEWIGHAVELLKYEKELPTARKIYCLDEDKIYNSVQQLANEWNINNLSSIYNICNNPYKGKKLNSKFILWLDEYEKMSESDVNKFINSMPLNRKKVICIDTGKVFYTAKEGAKYYDIKYPTDITHCCQKGRRRKYTYSLDGTKLQWMYYEDYLVQQENNKIN